MISKISILMISLMSYQANIYAESVNDVSIYADEDVPYVTMDANGNINGGITTEELYKVLKKLNIPKTKVEKVPWARAYHDVTTKPNIIIYPIVKTAERLEKLDYLFKLFDSVVYFFKLKIRTDIKIANLNDAKKYNICVQRDDYRAKYLMSEGFKFLDEATDSTLNVKKFIEGRCDLVISTEIGIQNKLKALKYEYNTVQKLFPLKSLDSALYAATNKQTSIELKKKFKSAAAAVLK